MSKEKAKTLDGTRTGIDELNIGSPKTAAEGKPKLFSRLRKIYKNLSLVMAGMYTGLGCYGTPHEKHSYDDSSAADKPDNRPI